jgi:hypothetical protein
MNCITGVVADSKTILGLYLSRRAGSDGVVLLQGCPVPSGVASNEQDDTSNWTSFNDKVAIDQLDIDLMCVNLTAGYTHPVALDIDGMHYAEKCS